jgi:hypothetical protein
MHARLLMLSLITACHRPSTVSTPSGDDTQSPPGDSSPLDSDPPSEPPEWIDGLDTAPPAGLCEVVLECGREIPQDPKIPCAMTVHDDQGRLWYQGSAGVEKRGRSTAGYDKAQYAVELWDDDGQELETDILGMGRESDWVLNGACIDRALLRNQLGFELYEAFSPDRYAAETAYCTLTLDGQWRGIYFLTERPKRAESRIDLDGEATDLGRAFVVKLDQSGGAVDNGAVGYGTWTLISPRQDAAAPAAINQVASTIGAWQAALLSPEAGDPEQGVLAHVDLDAAVDFVILEELMKNNDAFFLSVYLWKREDGLIQFSPWDLDLTLGQPTYNDNTNPQSWIAYRPAWVANLAASPTFRQRLSERWVELRGGVLADDALLSRVDGYRSIMGTVVYDNFEVWPIEQIDFGGYLPPRSSYDEEYEYVRDWIPRRTAWMDANIDAW